MAHISFGKYRNFKMPNMRIIKVRDKHTCLSESSCLTCNASKYRCECKTFTSQIDSCKIYTGQFVLKEDTYTRACLTHSRAELKYFIDELTDYVNSLKKLDKQLTKLMPDLIKHNEKKAIKAKNMELLDAI